MNGNWTYTYDDFNRLAAASMPPSTPTLAYSYTYDRFGNRWNQSLTTGTGWPMSLTFNGSNQITTAGFRYDATGNVLTDNAHCYTYDGENRLSSVAPLTSPPPPQLPVCGTMAMSYVYDPDGKRVARMSSGAVVEQDYYDAAGHEVAETNVSGTLLRAEIYAGARHLATWSSNATYFNHADWLGTERARSNSLGTVCETITSLPFGDGLSTSGNCGDPSPDHFTGKERDSESGLDMFGARYYGSSLGRFMTPDWAAKPTAVPYAMFGNPQSLNLYSYVNNNPTTTRDLDGHSDYLWQKFKNSLEGNGWKTDAEVKGLSVAQTAQTHVGSKDWAINGMNTSGKDVGHPQNFKPGQDKCNQFVGDTLAEAGKTRPEVPDGKGGMRMPNAHELADPNVHIPGLSDTKPISQAQPGDVIAQEHGNVYGHAGIVVGPGETVSANATGNYGGQITQNDWGFRPAGQNGESSTDPAPVVREPQSQ
ncbi:MAG: RHS repeat-associated core domain-containing protein [Terriglobia bacterium]